MRSRLRDFGRYSVLAFLVGLGSTLYVPTPMGRVAMFDLASYVFAIPLFLQRFPKYPKVFKRLLFLGVLWILNSIVTDFYRGMDFMIAFKAVMIMLNSLTLMIVCEWILWKTPRCIPYFLAGASISAVISLYYFQNGALLHYALTNGYEGGAGGIGEFLIEKQTTPLYVAMTFTAGVMLPRLWGVFPNPLCVLLTSLAGMYVMIHGGSRSTCLVYITVAGLMACYFYMPKFFMTLFKNKLVTLGCVAMAAAVFNSVYVFACKNGYLGEEGIRKYEEKMSGQSSFLDDRNDIIVNWPFLWRSPIIGAGTIPIDRWGYMDRNPHIPHTDQFGRPIHYTVFLGHSCIVGAWTLNGIFGLIFWAYILWLIFDFLGNKVFLLGDAGPFVIHGIIGIVWAVLFSPYGGFRGKAMMIAAFVALAKDPAFLYWLGRSVGVDISKLKIKELRFAGRR